MGVLSKEVGVIDIISILLGIAVGIIAGYFVRKNIYESKIGQANSEADRIIKQAEDDSKRIHKEKLLEAQKDPNKYRSLVVRVAGYSAFFVELDKDIQDEIISRTMIGA